MEQSEAARSQTEKALTGLRELIFAGEFANGERLAEASLGERLGLSRTPIRAALATLEESGLLEKMPSGGYRVRTFTMREIEEILELRGLMEGGAVRFISENGMKRALIKDMIELAEFMELTARQILDGKTIFPEYFYLNIKFHTTMISATQNQTLIRLADRFFSLPFAHRLGWFPDLSNPVLRELFIISQHQHSTIVEAIERREGYRAEALMREHYFTISSLMRRSFRERDNGTGIPGVQIADIL